MADLVQRYYYDTDGNVIRRDLTNVLNSDYPNFVIDENTYDIKTIKVVDGKIVNKTDDDIKNDKETAYNNLTWQQKRLSKYPGINDQIDAIYKGFMAIKETITLPQETLNWIAECEKVKKDIPKE